MSFQIARGRAIPTKRRLISYDVSRVYLDSIPLSMLWKVHLYSQKSINEKSAVNRQSSRQDASLSRGHRINVKLYFKMRANFTRAYE